MKFMTDHLNDHFSEDRGENLCLYSPTYLGIKMKSFPNNRSVQVMNTNEFDK